MDNIIKSYGLYLGLVFTTVSISNAADKDKDEDPQALSSLPALSDTEIRKSQNQALYDTLFSDCIVKDKDRIRLKGVLESERKSVEQAHGLLRKFPNNVNYKNVYTVCLANCTKLESDYSEYVKGLLAKFKAYCENYGIAEEVKENAQQDDNRAATIVNIALHDDKPKMPTLVGVLEEVKENTQQDDTSATTISNMVLHDEPEMPFVVDILDICVLPKCSYKALMNFSMVSRKYEKLCKKYLFKIYNISSFLNPDLFTSKVQELKVSEIISMLPKNGGGFAFLLPHVVGAGKSARTIGKSSFWIDDRQFEITNPNCCPRLERLNPNAVVAFNQSPHNAKQYSLIKKTALHVFEGCEVFIDLCRVSGGIFSSDANQTTMMDAALKQYKIDHPDGKDEDEYFTSNLIIIKELSQEIDEALKEKN